MLDKVNKVYSGIIVSVVNYGLYVEINETKCEGLVRLSDINGDTYIFDEKNYCLKGYNTILGKHGLSPCKNTGHEEFERSGFKTICMFDGRTRVSPPFPFGSVARNLVAYGAPVPRFLG